MPRATHGRQVMIKQRLDDETLGNGALRTRPCVEIDTAILQTSFQIWKKTFDKSKEHMRITFRKRRSECGARAGG